MQSFVRADVTEKENHFFITDAQRCTRFFFISARSKNFIDRMRDFPVAGVLHRCQQILFDGIRLNNICIHKFECVPRKQSVAGTVLVGNHVIADGNNFRLPPIFQQRADRSKTWSEEREPVLKNHGIGISFAKRYSDPNPIQRVHRVDQRLACYRQAGVSFFLLRLPRKKHFGILSLEGNYLYVVIFLQMGIQKSVVVCYAAAKRIRRAENKDVHCLRINRMLPEVA